ncbi:hypothetical protein WNY78_14080 [Psychroserpens sp. AS72]|uniref:hypothetical protein n=1 Tax=Psychroserpens sp. AS72 TaxID=3135775 RepID=UPI003176B22B
MRISFVILIGFVFFISCNQNGDIYKTKTGAYASDSGRFEARFPSVPLLDIENIKDGDYDFQVFNYKSILEPHQIFSVDYRDYPSEIFKDISDEDFLNNIATNYISSISINLKFGDIETIEDKDFKGIYLKFKPREHPDVKPMAHVKIIKKENRVYYISYVGSYNDKIDTFMKSFKIKKLSI